MRPAPAYPLADGETVENRVARALSEANEATGFLGGKGSQDRARRIADALAYAQARTGFFSNVPRQTFIQMKLSTMFRALGVNPWAPRSNSAPAPRRCAR